MLQQHAALPDVGLAYALKGLYDDTKISDPAHAAEASAALTSLAGKLNNPEVAALAAWVAGMAALQLDGQMERALELLDEAVARFEAMGKSHLAASTQVSRLHALAMLGRYDEAIDCGLRARDVCVAYGDELTAGKIEQNLGNIYWRRDQYVESEQLYRVALDRFVRLDDQKEIVKAYNNLANALNCQHKFRAASQIYAQALVIAETTKMEVMRALIEGNLGNLALFQGHYTSALDYLERSRRRYAALGMPHESAIAELELADAYLELNLASEASAIYARVTPTFAELGMRAEQARALAHYARTSLQVGQTGEARMLLAEAHTLYVAEGNSVGAAAATLTEAQTYYIEEDYPLAAATAVQAEASLAEAGAWGRLLLARWLRGEAMRVAGELETARQVLEATLYDAERYALPQLAQRCYTSLGLLASATGDPNRAERAFEQAIAIIETLRAPLPAEEFRTAFVSDKLTPYAELVRLFLADGSSACIMQALDYVERARSRALVDMLGGAMQALPRPRDAFETELLNRLKELREDLNWFYSQINRPPDGEMANTPARMEELYAAVRERESAVEEISRQIQQRGGGAFIRVEPLDIAGLQRDLGPDTALVEYFSLDGELLAFVVTDVQVQVVRQLGREEQVEEVVNQLRFQTDAMRHGADRMRSHLPQLARRVQHYLHTLHDLLLKPVEDQIDQRRLVVVPHRALHYVPFHALYDGTSYLIERREVCYAPSASVLHHCLTRPERPLDRALLLGVPDKQTPHVHDEVVTLTPLFPDATALLDEQATLAALRVQAPFADLLHLACHGQFRPDNPLFSSMHLADGWLTVRDAYDLELNCGLVTLSACETGVSAVAPGDELIGLARGFFSAGAPSLLVSLWTVDDATTAMLMTDFYTRLRAGDRPAAALRAAQCTLLQHHPHPFFWSPFVLLGRW